MSCFNVARRRSVFAILLIFLCSFWVRSTLADPLGTLPVVEAEQLRFIFEGRSDLWLSPYEDKESPIRIYSFKLRFPFLKFENFSTIFSMQSEEISLGRGDLLLGPNEVPIGSSLRAQQVGLGVAYEGSDKSSLTFFGSYASSSDEPYGHGRDIWPELTATYFSSYRGNWRAIFLANYSENRGFMNNQFLPAPGFGYKLNESFEVMFGYPFLRFRWTPNLEWRHLTAISPVGLKFESDYFYSDSLLLMAELGISTRSYLHSSRADDVDRAIYEEKFLNIGFKRILSPKTYVGFKFGGSFDRKVYQSTTVFNSMGAVHSLPDDLTGSLLLEFLP